MTRQSITISGFDVLTMSFILEQFITDNDYLYERYINWGLKLLRVLRASKSNRIEREIIHYIQNLKKPYWKEDDKMLELEKPEYFGIKLYRKICNKTMCCHKGSELNNGYYCFNPKKALFVRHTRTNRKGVRYAYGDYHCCARIVIDGENDMFSSSEKALMREML